MIAIVFILDSVLSLKSLLEGEFWIPEERLKCQCVHRQWQFCHRGLKKPSCFPYTARVGTCGIQEIKPWLRYLNRVQRGTGTQAMFIYLVLEDIMGLNIHNNFRNAKIGCRNCPGRSIMVEQCKWELVKLDFDQNRKLEAIAHLR